MGEFYDYKTGDVSSSTDLFDTSKTGMSYYNQFLDNLPYMQKEKNLDAEIVMMSPKEYFEGCADIFKSTEKEQIDYTAHDTEVIQHLKDVILVAKKKFPITFLNYAASTQEGRHRMYTAAELTSWDTKFPVLVIRWFDEDRHEQEMKARKISEIQSKIEDAIKDTLQYRYDPEDPEILHDELQIQLNHKFGRYLDDPDIEFELEHNASNNEYTVTVDDVSVPFDGDDIRWEKVEETTKEDEVENIDISDEDIETFLSKYL